MDPLAPNGVRPRNPVPGATPVRPRRQCLAGVGLLALLAAGLLAIRITAPWQYRHDDNGAWFSAIARTHLARGLTATRGQDFFLERQTGHLRPYLHHPPFIGLYLAGVFAVSGTDAPWVARGAVALLHLGSFVLLWQLARRLAPRDGRLALVAGFLFATAPMGAFFGKMPNHEAPGLLALLTGMLASVSLAAAGLRGAGPRALLFAAWLPVTCTAWQASLCAAGFILAYSPALPDTIRRPHRNIALGALLTGLALVGLQLWWAGRGYPRAGQGVALTHWLRPTPDCSWLRAVADGCRQGQRFYGTGAWWLAWGWAFWAIGRALKHRVWPAADAAILASGLGAVLYLLLFPRAVGVHAYQLFFLLPGVALAAARAALALRRRLDARRAGLGGAALAGLVLMTAWTTTERLVKLYRQPHPYALKASADLRAQFH